MSGKTAEAAAEAGFSVVSRSNGHLQIKGEHAHVDYWPNSRRKTAYCPQVGARRRDLTPKEAVEFCTDMQGQAEKAAKTDGRERKPEDIEIRGEDGVRRKLPVKTNPSGLKHFYSGDVPPWDTSLGEFAFMRASDEMRNRARRHEQRAIALVAEADSLDSGRDSSAA